MTGPRRPSIEALLLDLDGTLYLADAPLPGAVTAVRALADRGIPRRYLTNTTRFSRLALAERLQAMGFPIVQDEILTAASAARDWLAAEGISRVALYLPEAAAAEFAGFEIVESDPEAVVIGDLGRGWSFDRLNTAFQQILGGARLVALQKNRYWRTPDGLALDAGAFVAALEYGAGVESIVTGKPSPAFFQLAARALGVDPTRIAVVGDDIETDVAGAQAAGMRGILVRTGKFREELLAASEIQPDWIVPSLADLIASWPRGSAPTVT